MIDHITTLRILYERFNARDIDGVLSFLAEDVAWANGMEGGHVHGHAAVRDYWTRQWAMVSPHVEPVGFTETGDGSVIAEVRQTVLNLDGTPPDGRAHGLSDKTVGHVFRIRNGKITHFDIHDRA